MCAKRFWTQSAVYWTFLFAVMTGLTAFSQAQDAPASSSQIALDPSEMASIVGGGSCNKCIAVPDQDVGCDGNVSCPEGADCQNFDHCVARGANGEQRVCLYQEYRCMGAVIEEGKQCNQSSTIVRARITYCTCIKNGNWWGNCHTRTTITMGSTCNENGPATC